ncbi:MAG: M48 family metallopeptidase [Candidatus Omnitrophota bacterium]
MPSRLKAASFVIVISIILFLGGCTTVYNPATGREETLLIDTEKEAALGRDMDARLKKQLKLSSDFSLQNRLNDIGRRVAKVSDRQDVVYQFRVIADKELNAFALPGGIIYVNSGLLNKTNDDELASVIAHEVGHIAARHTVKKIQSILGYQIIMSIVSGVGTQANLSQATDIVFNLASLGYGRVDELMADKLAVRYLRRAGFSPYAMITLFAELKKEAQVKGANQKLIFLSSHPPIDERIKKVEKEINSNN